MHYTNSPTDEGYALKNVTQGKHERQLYKIVVAKTRDN